MNSIQYQVNIKQKLQEYYAATEHIRNARVELRNISLPKIILKNGIYKSIYSKEFLKADATLELLQNITWDYIFNKEA